MRSFLGILLVGLALLIIAAPVGMTSRFTRSTPASPLETVAPRLPQELGVTISLEKTDAAQRGAMLDGITESGFGWVRQRFPWQAIEPEPGVFDWQPWDAIVDDVTARGLTLVAVLDGSPSWARAPEDAGNPLAPPAAQADFGRFARAFAQRYGQAVQFYQIWDEPNIRPHWGQGLVDAGEYAGLLREAAVQVRAADSDAVVLTAALAPNVEPGGENQSDLAYLDELYQAGAAPWFDVVAAQPYGFDLPPSDPADPQRLNFRRAELLRDVMVRHGDAQTALWISAYGWHSPLDSQATATSPWQSVDEATQAAWAVDAAEWARGRWPWLGGLAWATWQPSEAADDPRWGFALITPQGAGRPVLAALQGWTQQAPVLTPGQWPLSAPAIAAEGGWRLTDQAADPPHGAAAGNNRLIVPFQGAGLALRVQRGPYWGYFDVTVDGQPAPSLPKDDEGRAILVLHDPLAGEETVTLAGDLPDGPHVAEIVATGGWDQWPLLGIDVLPQASEPSASRLPWLLAAAGLIMATVGGIGVVLSRRPSTRSGVGRPIRRTLERTQQLRPALRFGLLALAVVAAGLAPGWLQLPAIGALVVIFVIFPETGPALLAFLAPLFLVRVDVLGRPVNPVEAVAWLAVLAFGARWALIGISSRGRPGRSPAKDGAGNDGAAASAPALRSADARPTFQFMPMDWPVIAVVGVAAVAVLAAQNVGVALHEFRTVIVAGVLAYGLVRLGPGSPQESGHFDPWPVTWGLGLGAATVAGWGIVQAISGSQVIAAEGVLRVRGPYGSPNNLALYLDHVLPILIAVAFFARHRGRRIAAGLLSLIVLAGLVLTFSRGALLLGLPAALLFLGLVAGGRWRWVALGLLAVGMVLLLPLFRTERFAGLLDLQGGTGFFRLQLWRGAWNMIADHPWWGVGLDNFLYAYRTRYVTPAGWQELNLSHPHNIALDFWTRLGVFGVIAGAWLFIAAFWQGWRGLERLSDDRRAVLMGLLASLVAVLAHGLIDNSVFLVDLMVAFMLSLGMVGRLSHDL